MDCHAVIWTVHDCKWQVTVLTPAPNGGVSGTNSMNGPHKHAVQYVRGDTTYSAFDAIEI
jgi:hypothetical protein